MKSDNVKNAWWSLLIIIIMLVTGLHISGCSDPEPRQRAAFIVFLQTEIINKSRVNLSPLTSQKQEEIGSYLQYYQLLTSFNQQLKIVFTPLEQSIRVIQPMDTVSQLIDQQQQINVVLVNIKTTQQAMDKIIISSKAAHDALELPEDVKKVFEEAFNKVVINEVEMAKQALPLMTNVYTSMQHVIDFIKLKGNELSINNASIQFTTPEDLDTFNQLYKSMQEAYQKYQQFNQVRH